MRGYLSRTTKSSQFELRLAIWIGCFDFIRLNISHIDTVQNLEIFPNFFSQKLFDVK